ncbi:MAG: hypothetical protein R6U65_08480 [Perlabentimonas sp.]
MRTSTFSWELDFGEATTADSPGDSKEYVPLQDDLTIDFDGLTNPDLAGKTMEDIFDLLQNKTKFTVVYGGTNTGDLQYSQDAYMSNVEWSNAYDDLQSFSGTIQRTGESTKQTAT